MRILYVHDTLALWGGIERIFIDKMNYLADVYGYDVYMLTTSQGPHPIPFQLSSKVAYDDLNVRPHLQYRYRGLHRYWVRFWRQRMLRRKLAERIAAISPDVIVATTSRYIPQLLKLKGNALLVAESHSGYDHVLEYDDMTWRRRLEAWQLRRRLRKVDVLVALTEGDAKQWRTIHSHVRVIPNVVHDLGNARRPSTQEQRRVIFVGRFAKQKGLPDLLAVWRIVHQRHPDWQLDIFGDGEHKATFMQAVSSMDANIVVHSPSKDIFSQYGSSSILVLTSLYEPFGLVIVEAMSCGLPVVAFDCPHGPASIIADGQNGFLVRGRDIEAFADRVCQLIADRELRLQMGRRAMLSVQRYSAAEIMPQWKELFESLTTKR